VLTVNNKKNFCENIFSIFVLYHIMNIYVQNMYIYNAQKTFLKE